MLNDNLQPPFQSQAINDVYTKDIDDLKTGQLVNGEVIQSLAKSVSHIVSVIARVGRFVNTWGQIVISTVKKTKKVKGYCDRVWPQIFTNLRSNPGDSWISNKQREQYK